MSETQTSGHDDDLEAALSASLHQSQAGTDAVNECARRAPLPVPPKCCMQVRRERAELDAAIRAVVVAESFARVLEPCEKSQPHISPPVTVDAELENSERIEDHDMARAGTEQQPSLLTYAAPDSGSAPEGLSTDDDDIGDSSPSSHEVFEETRAIEPADQTEENLHTLQHASSAEQVAHTIDLSATELTIQPRRSRLCEVCSVQCANFEEVRPAPAAGPLVLFRPVSAPACADVCLRHRSGKYTSSPHHVAPQLPPAGPWRSALEQSSNRAVCYMQCKPISLKISHRMRPAWKL
jgi:hypothetical protein